MFIVGPFLSASFQVVLSLAPTVDIMNGMNQEETFLSFFDPADGICQALPHPILCSVFLTEVKCYSQTSPESIKKCL